MNSPFGWPGGKKNLKSLLLRLMPDHKAYVEVFSGSAKLLFAKEAAGWEILNDVNHDLVTFFRVAKHRPAELAERLQCELVAAERFRELREDKSITCEIERALRFIYLTWFSFGSKGQHFASATIGSAAKDKSPVHRPMTQVCDTLTAVADRLRRVLVECRDFAENASGAMTRPELSSIAIRPTPPSRRTVDMSRSANAWRNSSRS